MKPIQISVFHTNDMPGAIWNLLILSGEFVAKAAHRQQIARVVGGLFQLAAQTLNVHVHCARIA